MKRMSLLFVVMTLLMFSEGATVNNRDLSIHGMQQEATLNVLFIIADDLALQIGCYGHEAAHTPSLDRLAEQGVLFERAYAGGTVCTPSRKSFMTGLHVKTIGWGNNNYLRDHPETMTLPRWFREHGYHTAKIGKVMHTDEYEGPYDWDMNLNETETLSVDRPEVTYAYGSSAVDGSPLMRTGIYADEDITLDKARVEGFERFIVEDWDRSRPFFFALGFHTPHQRNDAHQRYFNQLPSNSMPLTRAPEGATAMTKPFPGTFTWWTQDFPDDQERKAVQGYYAAVTMMDDLVGRTLAFLIKEGLGSNTIIVFTSDQGYNLGYRQIWAKHVLYPSVLHVPLIVRVPGMPNMGMRTKGLVELIDIFPTLVELTGIPIPDGLDGSSFAPLLENPNREGKEAVYAQGILHRGSGIAVTTKNFTYMEWDEGAYREFYDLRTDPDAWFNQVGNPAYSEEINYLNQLIDQHFYN